MIYKEGQKVIIIGGISKPSITFAQNSMGQYVGKQAVLDTKNSSGNWRLLVGGISTGWNWHEEWFKPLRCCCGISNCIAKHRNKTNAI